MLREAATQGERSMQISRRPAHFDVFFDNANDGIFIIDPWHDRVVDANPKACQMLGYDQREIKRTPVSDIHPDDMERFLAFADSTRRFGSGLTDEIYCCTRSGDRVPVEMSASVIKLDGSTLLLIVARSIKKRVETERRYRDVLNQVTRHRDELQWERDYLREEVKERLNFGKIVGSSPALMQVLSRVSAVASTNANVLILGESGVGKELVARAIHDRSARADQALVKVNCPSVPRELFESEFFGHIKGAFTGAHRDRIGRCELADQGSLFLDEVGEIPLDLQAKLLQVLQDRQFCRVGEDRTRSVDVRIIAATNRNLLQDVKERRFREDLYYRLTVFPIEVPPLRERRGDIPLLIEHFLRKASKEFSRPVPVVNKADIAALQDYHWPGNVRELQNVIERAMILSRGSEIRLRLALLQQDDEEIEPRVAVEMAIRQQHCVKEDEMRQLQRANTIAALQIAGWRISGSNGAAELLGINPSTLAGRMKSLNIHKTPQMAE